MGSRPTDSKTREQSLALVADLLFLPFGLAAIFPESRIVLALGAASMLAGAGFREASLRMSLRMEGRPPSKLWGYRLAYGAFFVCLASLLVYRLAK